MANDIDQLPYNDPLVESQQSRKMSNSWISSISSLLQTLNGYLTQYGMLVPQITTDQRNSIQSPVLGQIIYNTTTNKFQGYEAGAWVDLI